MSCHSAQALHIFFLVDFPRLTQQTLSFSPGAEERKVTMHSDSGLSPGEIEAGGI